MTMHIQYSTCILMILSICSTQFITDKQIGIFLMISIRPQIVNTFRYLFMMDCHHINRHTN